MIRRTILAIAAGFALSFAAPVSADTPTTIPEAGEAATVHIYQQGRALHLAPNGFHIGKSDSRADAKSGEPRDPHEAWKITATGRADKNGNPTYNIESTNLSVGKYRYLAIAGTVQDGPKDPGVVGQMEISLSDTPFEWYAEEASSGVTLNVANAGGYVLEFRSEGNCVLGWDNDTASQLIEVRALD